MGNREKQITWSHKEDFRGDGCIHDLDCGAGFTSVQICQNLSSYAVCYMSIIPQKSCNEKIYIYIYILAFTCLGQLFAAGTLLLDSIIYKSYKCYTMTHMRELHVSTWMKKLFLVSYINVFSIRGTCHQYLDLIIFSEGGTFPIPHTASYPGIFLAKILLALLGLHQLGGLAFPLLGIRFCS